MTHAKQSASFYCWGLGLAAMAVLGVTFAAALGGCAADEPVGRTKTVTKTTEETPDGKRTTTETHEKDTKIIDRP